MNQPQNQPQKYELLFSRIDTGQLKIPIFQREFVWSNQQTARLLDSIVKGFPIGSFILWKTREELRHMRNIGNIKLPDLPQGDAALYVLDGQQRITSLYAVRKGLRITRDGEEIDYKRVSIRLDVDPEADEPVVVPEPPEDGAYISVHKLLTGTVKMLAKNYGEHLDKVDEYRSRLTGYDFATVVIEDYPIDVACEVFTRINTGGTELTLFEIMVAKTYDSGRDFNLADEYDALCDSDGAEKDLEDAGYETVPASVVLQCVSAHVNHQVRSRDILKIPRSDFIDAWPVVKSGLFAAVDYLRTHLRVPVSRMLPYPALLVPLTYFFIRNEEQDPSAQQDRFLRNYFWWASLTRRFSSGAEAKIALDLDRIDRILQGKEPLYKGEEARLALDDVRWHWFSTGDAFCKAILCLYAYHQPKSFKSNALVKLDNSWLKQTNSRNYHHFFPRAYLAKSGVEDWRANSIMNITLVDDYLNKRRIRARAPSEYMKEFRSANKDLKATMRSHLIDNLDTIGVWTDDYEKFVTRRARRVLREFKKALGPAYGEPSSDE